MSDVLDMLHGIVTIVSPMAGAYESIMDHRDSPYLQQFFQYLTLRADHAIAMGKYWQLAHHRPRDDELVSRHYHTGAGYIQLRDLAKQGLRAFYAALAENYVIFEGNQFVPDTFYTDFDCPE
ncbi:unnamed protein product [Peniophora sp. CBMAI 1063]|nr:unnamed protein product [Peniophora sp. CBMAI 1063]